MSVADFPLTVCLAVGLLFIHKQDEMMSGIYSAELSS